MLQPAHASHALSPTIHGRFEHQAALRPDAIAATCGDRRVSYGDLNSRANRLAHLLRSRGVSPDSVVGIYVDRSPELLIAVLGVLKAGGAYLPLEITSPAERLRFMIEDAGAPLVVTQSHLVARLPPTSSQYACLDEVPLPQSDHPIENPEDVNSGDHLAYVIYTSGSTGEPKGVEILHRNVIRLFDSTTAWFNFSERDTWTLFHSCAFDFSVWEMWGALLFGGRLIVVPYAVARSTAEFHRLLSEQGVTVLNQTPSAFRQLVLTDEVATDPLPLALRLVILGGEAPDMGAIRSWFDRHGDDRPRLVNMYGITETTVHVTYGDSEE